MKTVNSLSGGKTSSYIASKYPADLEVFSLVCIDNHNANAGRIDKAMIQRVNDKLQKYCSHMPEFLATAEDPATLKVMFDLEQHIGREIIWLRGIDFLQAIREKQSLPNTAKRWCTTILKIEPIFKFLFMYHSLPVLMRIGFRYDEMDRADSFKETFIYSNNCEYQGKSNRWINRWQEVPFRVGEFPLIGGKITHDDIIKYWAQFPEIVFPKDSNCQFCYWKDVQQLRANFDVNPQIMHSAMIMEVMQDHTFQKGISLQGVKKTHLQDDLFGMRSGSGCQGGYCTS